MVYGSDLLDGVNVVLSTNEVSPSLEYLTLSPTIILYKVPSKNSSYSSFLSPELIQKAEFSPSFGNLAGKCLNKSGTIETGLDDVIFFEKTLLI